MECHDIHRAMLNQECFVTGFKSMGYTNSAPGYIKYFSQPLHQFIIRPSFCGWGLDSDFKTFSMDANHFGIFGAWLDFDL